MNYTLKEKQNFEKMGVTAHLYEHNKTKAQVVYVENDDKNKTFGIGFKTPPTNSKGMAHIMEHSVLNGSDKYKTREPFMDMASSSLQTFLNAMTYPDKTVYPVSSENDQDFYNLTDVYLDAVFNPRVRYKKEILDQEGWHYEMDENDKITGISGVVYNEMKGALTDPDELVYDDFTSYLYKNSPYEYESGGDPSDIYKITYEEFLDFYSNHYHPSNAYIYFYGDLDIDFYLGHLDKEYLSKYEYKDFDYSIKVADNTYGEIIKSTYPASQELKSSDYLLYGFLTNPDMDTKYYLTLLILSSALFNMDSSKIRNQIQEEIDPEYFFSRVGYGSRSSIILQAQKADGEKLDRFVEIIEEGLVEASQGLNKETLKSAFSIFEYGQRDQIVSTMRGLTYYLMWSFDKPIFETFKMVDYLDELRSLIDTDYYENFIRDNFLDNPTKLVYLATPSTTYTSDKEAELNEYIENLNNTLTDDDTKIIKEDLKKLEIHQNTEDTEEEKASIPKLNISDVPAKTPDIPRLVEEDKYIFLHHDLETAGLIYASLFFDVGHLNKEELMYLSLINELLGSVDTKNLTYKEIDDILWQYLSNARTSTSFVNINDEDIKRFEKVSFTTTRDSAKKAVSLMKDFTIDSSFVNDKRVLELLRMRKSSFESDMYNRGHVISYSRANAHIDLASNLSDAIKGIDYYLFLKETIELAKNDYKALQNKLEDVYKKTFTNELLVNITSSEDDYSEIKEIIKEEFDNLEAKPADINFDFKAEPLKEAILTDANVNYVSKTADIKSLGGEFDGSLLLTASILTNPYLYELIRAKGGAYGAYLSANRNGLLSAFSYRDPKILETIENFNTIGELVKTIEMSDRDFENQQIGVMGSILSPQSPAAMGEIDFIRYLKDDPTDNEKLLAEIKNTKLSELKNFGELFDKAMAIDNICVFGNRKQLTKIKSNFDKVIDLNN